MKKLLILGASINQLPAIIQANKKNIHTITADNTPTNPGHALSKDHINISTTDTFSLLAYAKSKQIDGVMTLASDVCLRSVGYLCDQLSLPGVTESQTTLITRKDNFRTFQAAHKLNHPIFFILDNWADFLKTLQSQEGTFIMKPVDRSGSAGIHVIQAGQRNIDPDLKIKFETTLGISFAHKIILEKYMTGTEWSFDGFVLNGTVHTYMTTNKYVQKLHSLPYKYSTPSRLSADLQHKVLQTLNFVFAQTRYQQGPFTADMIILPDQGVFIVEMTFRIGGNNLSDILYYGYHFDIVDHAINYALRISQPSTPTVTPQPCGMVFMRAKENGRLSSIRYDNTIIDRYSKNIRSLTVDFQPGQLIHAYTESRYKIGTIIVTASTVKEVEEILIALENAVHIQVDS